MAAQATVNLNVIFTSKNSPIENKVSDAANIFTTQTGSGVFGATLTTVTGSTWVAVPTGSLTNIGTLYIRNTGTSSYLDVIQSGSAITASRLSYGDPYVYKPVDGRNLYVRAANNTTASVVVCVTEA